MLNTNSQDVSLKRDLTYKKKLMHLD